MNGQKNDNPQAQQSFTVESFDGDFVPDDALPLCPKCLTPCQPLQYYCPYCNSNGAINPLTPYIPFLNIRFNYDIFCTMWWKIWYDPHTGLVRRMFYLLMISLFAPILVIVGLPLLLLGKISQPFLRNTTIMLLSLIAFAFLTIVFCFGLIGLI